MFAQDSRVELPSAADERSLYLYLYFISLSFIFRPKSVAKSTFLEADPGLPNGGVDNFLKQKLHEKETNYSLSLALTKSANAFKHNRS